MKLIERLTADYDNGKFANGILMTEKSRSDGSMFYFRTNNEANNELYMFRQATNGYRIFMKFVAEHSIEVKDVTERKLTWNDNWRNEHGCNSTEKVPSFKSKW